MTQLNSYSTGQLFSRILFTLVAKTPQKAPTPAVADSMSELKRQIYAHIADSIPVCCGMNWVRDVNPDQPDRCVRFNYATQDWIDVGTLPSGNTYHASSIRQSKLGLLIASGQFKGTHKIFGDDLWRIDGPPGVLDDVNTTVICAY